MALPNPLGATVALRPDDRLFIFGEYWRPVRSDRDGHCLASVFDRSSEIFITHYDFGIERNGIDFKHEIDWFRPECVTSRMAEQGFLLRHLPKADQNDVTDKIRWIREFYGLLRAGAVHRTSKGYAEAVVKISIKFGVSRAFVPWNVDEDVKKRANRGSRKNRDVPPSPATLRRYVENLEAAEFDLSCLRDGRFRSGNRRDRFSSETRYLLEQYARKFASYRKLTRLNLYQRFRGVFARLSRRFESEGRAVDSTPSYSRFCLEIAKLNQFEVDIARLGRERAGRKWRTLGIGPDVSWALERVEMDFYEIDLQVLLVEAAIWENLPKHLRIQIKRSRWYLCVAIDVASRCVLGMKLSRSENSKTAVETLRMCFYDKTHIGRAAGALSPWDQHGSPDGFATDMGTAFVNADFTARAVSVLADIFNPPAAQPQLRPFVERFFRTVKENLLKRFEGNTGGSIRELGDYPAQLRAVLTIDQFADLLVRWCVDVYHNMQHDGLGRETPRDAWLRLTRLKKPRPCPDERRLRESFGIDVLRRTGRPGIRIAGLYYNSEELQAWCRAKGDAVVDVRIDPENIGGISVRLDPKSVKWISLPCRTRFMRGRKLRDWLLAASDLRRMYGEVADIRLPIVLQAIEAIERTHSRAVGVAEIGPGEPTDEEIADYERELGIGFSIPSDDETFEDAEPVGGDPPVRSGQPTLPSSFGAAFGRSFPVGGSIAKGPMPADPVATSASSAAAEREAGFPDLSVPDAPSTPGVRTDQSPRPDPDADPPILSDPAMPPGSGRRRNPWAKEK
ncbi:Integrase catalytic domain-containing protein [Methylorubrum thiocyanatum]